MRRLSAILSVTLAACLLTACAASTPSAKPPRLDPPPPELTRECPLPVDLPKDGGLTQRQAERLWGLDRKNLKVCGTKLRSTAEFYRKRDAGLKGAKP